MPDRETVCVPAPQKTKAEENPFVFPRFGGSPSVPEPPTGGVDPSPGEGGTVPNGDDEDDEPYCRQDDEAVDNMARGLADDLASRCFSDGVQSDPEAAYIIYRDGPGSFSVGSFCTGNSDGVPNMGEVDLIRCVSEDERTQHDVVGTIHCGYRWSTLAEDGVRSDDHALQQFGRFL